MRYYAFGLFLFLCLSSVVWGQRNSDPAEVNRTGVSLLQECRQVVRPPAELTATDAAL